MRKDDHFSGITAFVCTAQHKTFTAAAERLNLTKSAVAKSVSRLEERLGVKLLHRSTRQLTLTPEGEAYLKSCLDILGQLECAEALLQAKVDKPSGKLRIDLPAAFGRKKVLPLLLAMSAQYPELSLAVTFNERFVDIVEEGLDVVVRIGELQESSGLVARHLTVQKMVMCAAPDYVARRGVPSSFDDLKNHDCVVSLKQNQPLSWVVKNCDGETVRFKPPATHEFSDGDAIREAVIAGCGISQLPLWLIRDDLQAGRLQEVLPGHCAGSSPIHAVWPKNRHLLPKVRFVIDELVDFAQQGQFD